MAETSRIESQCVGRRTLSTKVDGETRQWVESRAAAAGATPTEFLRRLLDVYHASADGRLSCSHCKNAVDLTETVET